MRERVLEAIQHKVEGQEITAEPTEAPQTKIIDLMDALKASLAKRGASTTRRNPPSGGGGARARKGQAEEEGSRALS